MSSYTSNNERSDGAVHCPMERRHGTDVGYATDPDTQHPHN